MDSTFMLKINLFITYKVIPNIITANNILSFRSKLIFA